MPKRRWASSYMRLKSHKSSFRWRRHGEITAVGSKTFGGDQRTFIWKIAPVPEGFKPLGIPAGRYPSVETSFPPLPPRA